MTTVRVGRRRGAIAGLVAIASWGLVGCGGDDTSDAAPGVETVESAEAATYEFVIPPGAGEALDAGEPLEILPGRLEVTVGETISIVNDDERGHNVGPFFVGAGETLRQRFSSPGEFVGVCTVHPSGQLVLIVDEA